MARDPQEHVEVLREKFAAGERGGSDRDREALLAMEHAREDAANKAQVLEWIDDRRRDGDLSADQAAELVKLLSTRQMSLEREEQNSHNVCDVRVPRH